MTYAQKLRDPRWQKKRLEVFQRDNFECVWCSSTDQELHVHHLQYRAGAQPWEYPLENFVSLCKSCHTEAEDLLEEIRVAMKDARSAVGLKMLLLLLQLPDGPGKGVGILIKLLDDPAKIKPLFELLETLS